MENNRLYTIPSYKLADLLATIEECSATLEDLYERELRYAKEKYAYEVLRGRFGDIPGDSSFLHSVCQHNASVNKTADKQSYHRFCQLITTSLINNFNQARKLLTKLRVALEWSIQFEADVTLTEVDRCAIARWQKQEVVTYWWNKFTQKIDNI